MLKDRIFNLIAKNERLKNDVSNAKELNKRHDYYSNKLNKYSEIKENLYNYLSILNAILLRCEVEDTKFKERRLEFLEQDIQEYFSLVFPEDGFTPKLYYKHYKGKPIASLKLVPPSGKEEDALNPKNSASGLQKQLVTFTGSALVCLLLGSNIIFIDEAFSASSDENKAKLGNILNKFKDNGMQIFLISQSSDLYKDLERREIYIDKKSDSLNSLSYSYVKDIKDWGVSL